jgi:small-conductance mechanosensitive channel
LGRRPGFGVKGAGRARALTKGYDAPCAMTLAVAAAPPEQEHKTRFLSWEALMPHRYVLVLRFVLVNLLGLVLTASAYFQGWLQGLFDKYTWSLSLIIVAVFLYGLVICGLKIWQTSLALNEIRAGKPSAGSRAAEYIAAIAGQSAEDRSILVSILRMKISHRVSIVRQVANSLVFLGLIGTVIGFIIALSGVDAKTVSDVNSISTMVGTLISGMSLALYTTLLGAVLNVWLNINHRILATGSINLLTAIVEKGEARGSV